MQLPAQITFRHMPPSEAMEKDIRRHCDKLEQFCDDIISCRVVVTPINKRHHKGNLYQVKIDLTVPGRELVVTRDAGLNHAHEDAYVAVRDAFDAMRRELEDYVRRRRGEVKHHESPPQGRVLRLVPEGDHGFIQTPDGREIYFHRNSVVDGDFDRLQPGTLVTFHEVQGAEGPQASTVHVKGP